MKRSILFSISAACLVVLGGCSKNLAPTSHYQNTPVLADGQMDDWSKPLRFVNPQRTLAFNITTDNKNIYIVVTTKDDRMQNRILKAGMDVFFDPKGAQNHTIDLSFPESNSEPPASGAADTNPFAAKQALVSAASTYNTSGFLNIENGQFGLGDKTTHIQVALGLSADSALVYEAIVPLYTVLKSGGLDNKTLKKNFSIGIIIGHMPDRSTAGRGNGNGGGFRPHMGFGMGMGGMGGGVGMGMGGGGGRGGNRNSSSTQQKDESDWYTFRFAPNGNTVAPTAKN
jgi:hypothetical protein